MGGEACTPNRSSDMVSSMGSSVADIVVKMRRAPNSIRYAELYKVCVHYFGDPRQQDTSHAIFNTGWQDVSIVNIQSDHGRAKRYQVLQVLKGRRPARIGVGGLGNEHAR